MCSLKHQKALGLMPWERFVTTYNCDYKPFSQHQLQVNQSKPRIEAAPAFISPPQTDRETWPICHQYVYSVYGSSGCSEPPSCPHLPAFTPLFGTTTPSISTASVVGSALTEARKQEVGVARETGPFLFEPEKGQLHYVFVGKANMLEQEEATDEPQMKNGLYEEGLIVLSSQISSACGKNPLRSAYREDGLLHLPVTSSLVTTIKDAESWNKSAYLRGWRPNAGLTNITFHQPTSRQCSCCAWDTECQNSWKTQPFPHGSAQSQAQVQLPVYCKEASKKLWLTEYQASYTPPIQPSNLHRHACHQVLHH